MSRVDDLGVFDAGLRIVLTCCCPSGLGGSPRNPGKRRSDVSRWGAPGGACRKALLCAVCRARGAAQAQPSVPSRPLSYLQRHQGAHAAHARALFLPHSLFLRCLHGLRGFVYGSSAVVRVGRIPLESLWSYTELLICLHVLELVYIAECLFCVEL